MIFAFKSFLGIVAVASASAAIGVPLLIKNSSGEEIDSSINSVSLSYCEDDKKEGLEVINFGASSSGNVCGSQGKGSTEYTKLFKDNGGRQIQDWKSEDALKQWTNQCIFEGLSFKGVITPVNSERVNGYLGLCGDSSIDQLKFVKQQKEGETQQLSLGTCDSDCGASVADSTVGDVKVYSMEKEGSGKKVEFYNSFSALEK